MSAYLKRRYLSLTSNFTICIDSFRMAGWEPYVALIFVQTMFCGVAIFSKAAFNGGMDTYIFVFYRQAIAALLFVPFAIAAARRKTLPTLTPILVVKIFMLAFFGLTINLNVYCIGIKYTSATVASATMNSIPVFTIILAVLVRVEKIKLKRFSGSSKILGLALCICGVLTIALYRGPQLKILNHLHPLLHKSINTNHSDGHSSDRWITGSFLMVCSALLWCLWVVLQGMILKDYPSSVLFTTLTLLFSTIQSFVVAIMAERKIYRWKLQWDQGLIAVIYSGIFVAGIASYLQAWCNKRKGPVFVAMFSPLGLIFTIACSSFILGEVIILGSVLGGALMVGGLYSVLWGKRREEMEKSLSTEEI